MAFFFNFQCSDIVRIKVIITRCLKIMSSPFSETYLANSISRYILDLGNNLLFVEFVTVLETTTELLVICLLAVITTCSNSKKLNLST